MRHNDRTGQKPEEHDMEINQLSSLISEAAINVHKEMGPCLLESLYRSCMLIELENMALKVQAEVVLPVFYRGQRVHDEEFQLDLLVEDRVIISLKSAERVQDMHKKQLLTWLRLSGKPLGMLLNFGHTVHITIFPGFAAFGPWSDSFVALSSGPSRTEPRVFRPTHVSA
jgi:GxxExxY protein